MIDCEHVTEHILTFEDTHDIIDEKVIYIRLSHFIRDRALTCSS